MKNSSKFWIVSLFALCTLTCLTSWIAGIYNDDVQGLLTGTGIRWMIVHAMPNFASAPLAKIICALIAISGIKDCGILSAFSGHVSLKQRHALIITSVAIVILMACIAILAWLPGSILLSAFGTVEGSPLQKGWYGVTIITILIISSMYGYTSSRFARMSDWLQAHTSLFAGSAPYFITLFLSTQLIAFLQYSNIIGMFGNEDSILAILTPILYYIPLLLHMLPFFVGKAR